MKRPADPFSSNESRDPSEVKSAPYNNPACPDPPRSLPRLTKRLSPSAIAIHSEPDGARKLEG